MISDAERRVVDSLVAAWDAWLTIPGKHPDDDHEFRHHLHALQSMVAYRVACRAEPTVFGWGEQAERSDADDQDPQPPER